MASSIFRHDYFPDLCPVLEPNLYPPTARVALGSLRTPFLFPKVFLFPAEPD